MKPLIQGMDLAKPRRDLLIEQPIKEEQEKAAPRPKAKLVRAKNGYKKTGYRPPSRPS